MNAFHRFSMVLAAVCLSLAGAAVAQQETQEQPPEQPQPLTAELSAELDGLLEKIDQERADAARTLARIPDAGEQLAPVLNLRLAEDRLDLLREGVSLAERVAELRDDAFIVDEYIPTAIDVLLTHPDIVVASTAHVNSLVVVPTIDMGAAEQAAVEQRFFSIMDVLDQTIDLLAQTFVVLNTLGGAAPEAEAEFEARLIDRAENASVYLHLAQTEAAGVRAGLAALPDDTELTGKLAIAEARIRRIASVLERRLRLLEDRDIDVSEYRQELVLITGQLTPDAFRVGVFGGIIARWGERVFEFVATEGPNFALRMLLFALILYVFYKLARVTRRLVAHGLEKSKAQPSRLLSDMVLSWVGNLVMFLGALIALSQIGISLGPVLAGLGIAGFVIGFALQDSLSNFASGMLILFTRPYDVGDVVELGGVLGEVKKMSLVNTTIHTFDNQQIILPNTMIWGGIIKNVTAQSMRRVDMVFGISYSDDIEKTERVINEVLNSHELILDDPKPVVKVHELGDSSVNFIVRPWVRTDDYWNVYWDITRAVKLRFDREGISIPFPQRDVHLIADKAPQEAS